MTLKTVTWVAPELNAWESNGKTTYYINVAFSDDTAGSLGKQNPDKAVELKAMLEELIDQEVEFGLEDRGKTTKDGKTKFSIKSFPGYEPEPWSGGGGGGGGAPMDKAGTALLAAATLHSNDAVPPEEVTVTATMFLEWLNQQSAPGATPPPPSQRQADPTTPPSPGGSALPSDATASAPEGKRPASSGSKQSGVDGSVKGQHAAPSTSDDLWGGVETV